MEVQFGNKKLRKCFEEFDRASRAWGSDAAKKYIQCILVFQNMRSPEDLNPFRQYGHHELKGDRSGEHVVSLGRGLRLHFVVSEDVVTVLEVTKHYGD